MASKNKLSMKKTSLIFIAAVLLAAIFIFYPRETVKLTNFDRQSFESNICLGSNIEHINARGITYRGIPSINSRIYNDPCESDNTDVYWMHVFEDGLSGALVGGLLVLVPILIAASRPTKTNDSGKIKP